MSATEPRTFASLSSTLLARKGHAKPAMRPQGFAGFDVKPGATHDDLGWNDMGHDVPAPTSAPSPSPALVAPVPARPASEVETRSAAPPPAAVVVPIAAAVAPAPEPPAPAVVQQQAALANDLAAARAAVGPIMRALPGSKDKAAFTLRLDRDRHLRLRLACAVTHRSAQQLLIDALDRMLATLPAIATLAASVDADATTKGS